MDVYTCTSAHTAHMHIYAHACTCIHACSLCVPSFLRMCFDVVLFSCVNSHPYKMQYGYVHTYMHVHVYMEHLDVWGELASHKRLFNPPPQFSRLGILVSLRPIFIFLVCDVHICVPLFVLVGITFLSLYSLASVLCTCISMYMHVPVRVYSHVLHGSVHTCTCYVCTSYMYYQQWV